MVTRRLALILASTSSLALLGACQEPNAPQAGRPAAPSQEVAADPVAEAAAASGERAGAAQLATLCNIEAIGDQVPGAGPVTVDGPVGVKGWLADPGGASPSQPRLVVADEKKNVVREIPVGLSIERPDVVDAFPDQKGLEKSGFQSELDPEGLQPKTYHLYLAYSMGQVEYSCDNGRYLLVR